MKKIIRLSESELVTLVSKLLKEYDSDTVEKMVEPYLESGAVRIKKVGSYLVVDVESPSYFRMFAFDPIEGLKIKSYLRNNGFSSVGVGEYAKKIK